MFADIFYRDKDGLSDHFKFIGDWTFSDELLEYIDQTYGESRWAIDHCYQTGPGTFTAHFRPYYGFKGSLCIHIVYNKTSETGWDFTPG